MFAEESSDANTNMSIRRFEMPVHLMNETLEPMNGFTDLEDLMGSMPASAIIAEQGCGHEGQQAQPVRASQRTVSSRCLRPQVGVFTH